MTWGDPLGQVGGRNRLPWTGEFAWSASLAGSNWGKIREDYYTIKKDGTGRGYLGGERMNGLKAKKGIYQNRI